MLIGIFLIIATAIIFLAFFNRERCSKYKVGGKNYCLLVADSPEKREKGLMHYRKPVGFDGMIFIFPNYEKVTFWNYSTYLDLDVLWLKDEQLVGKSFLPSIEKSKATAVVDSPGGVNRVVELIR